LAYQSGKIIDWDDHQKCVSQGIEPTNQNKIIVKTYWQCRYDLVVSKRIFNTITPETIKRNNEIDKIAQEFLDNVSRATYALSTTIDDKAELSDHNRCIISGYGLTINQPNYDYYRCRQDLIIAHLPPNSQQNEDFNQEISQIIAATDKYSDCSNLNISSEDFKQCAQSTKESRVCVGNIYALKIKKELKDKIYCQQQSFIQFPDNYALAKNKSTKEIEKLMLAKKKAGNGTLAKESNATLEYLEGNKNITTNIGRYSQENSDEEEQSKNEPYNRIELFKLRESFMYQCNKNMDNKLPYFVDQSLRNCLDIAKNWNKNGYI
jgi:hypothetical protein